MSPRTAPARLRAASIVAQNKDKRGVFETSTGLSIRIKAVDPTFVQTLVNSVQMPKVPTYETRTISGRVETHRYDEKVAAQREGGQEVWDAYIEERAAAQAMQNERVFKGVFLVGAECDVPEDGWHRKWEFLDIPVPQEPDERRTFWLLNELPTADVTGLLTAIMRLTGVDEEAVRQAEDAFRDSVRADNSEG